MKIYYKGNLISILIFVLSLSFLAGCEDLLPKKVTIEPSQKKEFKPQGIIVAQVGDTYITLAQLNEEISTYNEILKATPEAAISSTKDKLDYLNNEIVKRNLFYIEAKSKGFDKDPKTQDLLNQVEINLVANNFIQQKINSVKAEPNEIQNFFNTYKDQFNEKEQREIREIAVSTKTEANEILIELLRGSNFSNLARQYSKTKTSSNGGYVGYIEKDKRGQDYAIFDEIVFSSTLKAGDNSTVFQGDDNYYYIVKVENIKPSKAKSLSEVHDIVSKNVLFYKQQEELEKLYENLSKNIEVNIYNKKIK
ncbi:MAG: peptidyl-prolyl cis-trans isomerase [Candidatus Omnitrophica bacterium]|nr:peptidyl-prolyl cis-trans isomerase [Candidatus Omnitrophota bacterium]